MLNKIQNTTNNIWIKIVSSVIRIRFYFCRIITYIAIHVFIIYKGEYEAI